jgi:hypothetical protein
MTVRHLTCVENVDDLGFLVDATRCCHGTITAGLVDSLSGPIDPLTHLNEQFRDHVLSECAVAERLEVGAPVLRERDGQFRRAAPRREAMGPLGRVDTDERRIAWLDALGQSREKVARVRG